MFLVALIVKFLDPLLIVLAIAGGVISRSWWHVLLTACVVGAIQEAVLFGMQHTRVFNPVNYLAGVAAAWCWAALAHFIRKKWAPRSKAS
jgi:hypothetical protein